MRIRRSLLTAAVIAALAVCLTSCTSIQQPEIRLESVDLVGVSTDGMRLRLLTVIENPNDFGADITGLAYRIYGDDVELASGNQTDLIQIPAGGTVEVDVPFVLTWSSGKTILEGILDGEEHDWKLEGSVDVRKGVVRTTFAFSESGNINSPDSSQDL